MLVGITGGTPAVLLTDQLDAVSELSGRDRGLFDVFAAIEDEIHQHRTIRQVIACRSYDLERDYRLRRLLVDKSKVRTIKINRLDLELVSDCLVGAGLAADTFTKKQLEILRTPVHLALLLETLPQDHPAFRTSVDLFDRYWDFKRDRISYQLGRDVRWSAVIDRIINALTDRRTLQAPFSIFDDGDLAPDANAFASANVFVRDGEQCRFFHETFFDYCVARRMYSNRAPSSTLVDWLVSQGEQHLGLRGQIRQGLEYGRERDFNQYLVDIDRLLTDERSRFHMKSMVVNWITSATAPTQAEWAILKSLVDNSSLRNRILVGIRPNIAWFDILDECGEFSAALQSKDDERIDTAIWQLTETTVLEKRSSRIAELLEPFYGSSDAWTARLHRVMAWGEVHHSRRMFNLFLLLVDDGTIFESRPIGRDDAWMCFYKLGEEAPELCAEAIGHWLQHVLSNANAEVNTSPLDQYSHSQTGEMVVRRTAEKAPDAYRTFVIPQILNLAERFTIDREEGLLMDRVFTVYLNHTFSISGELIAGARLALETLANSDPGSAESVLDTIATRPLAISAWLVMHAWAANPTRFADRCMRYLLEVPARLSFGFGSWVGGGDGRAAVARSAFQQISPYCSDELFEAVESKVLQFKDDDDTGSRWDGITKYLLLLSLDTNRLSHDAKRELEELSVRFGQLDTRLPDENAEVMTLVQSPIAEDKASLMTDAEWLAAMRTYPEGNDSSAREFSGGCRELGDQLRRIARTDRRRFAALVQQMDDSISGIYFSEILNGLIGNWLSLPEEEKKKDDADIGLLGTREFESVIVRMHTLPGRPCGRAICDAIDKLSSRDLSTDVLNMLAWYAINDPDPQTELWKTTAGGHPYYGGNPYDNGINTVRGNAAQAIRACLFDDFGRRPILDQAIQSLIRDPSTAVRCCVVEVLYPILNHSPEDAAILFLSLNEECPGLWGSGRWEHFVHYACPKQYAKLRALLKMAACSESEAAAKAASRQIALVAIARLSEPPSPRGPFTIIRRLTAQLIRKFKRKRVVPSLDSREYRKDLDELLAGGDWMRFGVADVAASNLKNSELMTECSKALNRLFFDESDEVRTEAATCFSQANEELLERSSDLVRSFIGSPAFSVDHNHLVHALADLNCPLPGYTLNIISRFLKLAGPEASSVAHAASLDASHVSKLVFRLYDQTDSEEDRTTCLDFIDLMEEKRFYGVESELRALDA